MARYEDTHPTHYEENSIVSSSLWMIGISLVLFFIPAINGLIGGAVGGYKAGNVSRALTAAVLPALVVGLVLWALMALFDAAILGFFVGVAGGAWALFSSIGLLIGAAIGGAMAPKHHRAV